MDFEAFYKISYGLYVISASNGKKINGYIANTAFQVTASPPQIAISCNTDNFTCGLIEQSKKFSISILNQNAKAETIGLFGYKSGKDIDKFESIDYTKAQSGTPVVLEDCIAWFDCKVNQVIEVGSHKMFIATIVENNLLNADADPLTYEYYRKVKKGVAPKNAPTYIDKSPETPKETDSTMTKYKCLACGYIYDPAIGDEESGIEPGIAFEDLPDDWTCPTCGSPKEMFEAV
ncbi:flavin reductase [Carboxylicivirga sp. N1Y90]|uniref:flavin reductase n=1 Tax=Carboxylicivirga fragile TaxID=3417571 RepID=UPI003D33A667|nr:flavin reductase [Marinilabiliaceae bacterium N1Y90]